ncbi:hypothetical protein Tco_1403941 [Tanacetum coccineum]
MANIRTCNKHNMIACVEKTAHNADFYQIIDYLTGCSINYSLLVNPDLMSPKSTSWGTIWETLIIASALEWRTADLCEFSTSKVTLPLSLAQRKSDHSGEYHSRAEVPEGLLKVLLIETVNGVLIFHVNLSQLIYECFHSVDVSSYIGGRMRDYFFGSIFALNTEEVLGGSEAKTISQAQILGFDKLKAQLQETVVKSQMLKKKGKDGQRRCGLSLKPGRNKDEGNLSEENNDQDDHNHTAFVYEVEDESETAITLIHMFILWTTEDGGDS